MKNVLKNLILIILIIAVACGVGFLIYRAIRSVSYNKNAKNPILTLEVEGYGEIQIELEPDYAPNTVATIVKLAQNGYYDGKVFYGTDSKAVAAGMYIKTEETVENEDEENTELNEEENNINEETEETATIITKTAEEDVLRVSDLDKSITPYVSEDDENYANLEESQRGDEETDYKISINGEFVANGFNSNTIRFEKGTVGLYRSNYNYDNLSQESYNSGTSLFFITTGEDSSLNGEYAAFGKVIKGMDIIEKMLELPLEESDEEQTSMYEVDAILSDNQEIVKFDSEVFPVITKATVETYGVDYGMPEYKEAFDYSQYISDLLLQYYRNQ